MDTESEYACVCQRFREVPDSDWDNDRTWFGHLCSQAQKNFELMAKLVRQSNSIEREKRITLCVHRLHKYHWLDADHIATILRRQFNVSYSMGFIKYLIGEGFAFACLTDPSCELKPYITAASDMPPKKNDDARAKTYSGQENRRTYPKAYDAWSRDEDQRLRELYEQGMNVTELSERFQRKRGAIRARLRRLSKPEYG